MVMVDDSHATGFVGTSGRGTPEYCGVLGRVDIITSTLGKALGGALGWLHGGEQAGGRMAAPAFAARISFPTHCCPPIAGAALKVLDMIEQGGGLRRQLYDNAARFRANMEKSGFKLAGASTQSSR